MRRLLRVCALALFALGVPLAASAQTAIADDDRNGVMSVGAIIGGELDTSDNWLVFGADTRIQATHGIEFEPRFTYQPLNGGHNVQLDVNVLKNFDLARPGRFRPFFGIGGTLRLETPDEGNTENKVGLNFISGTRMALSRSRGYEPFIVGEYSIIQDEYNSFALVIGASFRLRN